MDRARLVAVCLVVVTVAGLAVPLAGAGAIDSTHPDLECSYPLTVTDASGEEVTVEESPDEIVVMHASAAQVVHDIGKWDNVTGAPVTSFTAYLEDHDAPEDVTDDQGWPIVEVIVDLDPDLVIAGHVGDPDTVAALRAENLTVYHGPTPTTVDDIKEKVHIYGALTGACDGAAERVDWMDERLAAIDEMVDDGEERPLAYFELGDGWTTGEGTFQHDMIERSGADNLGAEADLTGWGQISEEVVIERNPDFVVYGDTMEEPPVTDALRELPAIQQDRTVAVDSNLMNQAGPRVVLVMETLAEAFAEGPIEEPADDEVTDDSDDADEPVDDGADDGDDTMDEGDEEPPEEDDDEATVTEPEEDDDTAEALPALGPIAALVAILVGALLASRS